MIYRKFEEITFEDIQALFDNEVAESRTLEYKSILPHDGESEKVPFLAGVCALANTDGGDIIFGIEDEKGIPIELKGVNIQDQDKEILRLENSIRNGIEPRLMQIHSRFVESPDHKRFLVLRIGKSWNSPHRVSHNSKFYKRNSAGKYSMDISEIRTSFLLSEQISDRIHGFRDKRINKLKNHIDLPTAIFPGPKIVLHLVPLRAFTENFSYPIEDELRYSRFLTVIGSHDWNMRYNLDGILHYTQLGEQSFSYTQFFRTGIIEAVASLNSRNNDEGKYISKGYEGEIIKGIISYIKLYKELEAEPPIYFFISLIDVKDYKLYVDSSAWQSGQQLDREDIILPEGLIESLDIDPAKILQPFFNMVWNAFGFMRSFNYNEHGQWVGRL